MIGIDWGTSSFRAYRMDDRSGAVLERIETGQGILEVPPGGFAEALAAAIGPWLATEPADAPVLLCGMVGSRQGWQEAPYLACPAGPAEIARALTLLPFAGARRCLLVPGLSTRDATGVPDVMRGEETKLIGLLEEVGEGEALACLPGTHSKWARVGGGRILGFATHMTGEVRATLLEHSILGRLAAPGGGGAGEGGDDAFRRGLRRAREGGGLLHHLFGTRALGLMGDLAPEETEPYLSGLLIGHEIAAAVAAGGGAADPVHLAGADILCRRYAIALEEAGLACRRHEADLAARGLARLARGLA
jgi:2-dehydro-3-deoxygalactonokinase